jgi:cyclic-di-AMP phosphodiesterase PgpH
MRKPLQIPSDRHRLFQFATTRKKDSRAPEPASSPHIYWQKSLLVAVTILILSVVMTVHLVPDKIKLKAGDVSPREITAQRSVIFVNTVATAQNRQAARLSTPPVYDTDDRAAANAVKIVNELFGRIDSDRVMATEGAKRKEQAIAHLQTDFNGTLHDADLRALATMPPAVYQRLKDTTLHLVNDAMEREIKDLTDAGTASSDLRHARLDVRDSARDTLTSDSEVRVVEAVAERALQPNRLLNRKRTEAVRDAASRDVAPVYGRIVRGETIVAQGERVTQEHLDKLQGLGMLDPRFEIQTGAATCIVAALMVLLVSAYVKRALPRLYSDIRRLCLLSFIVLLSVIGLKLGAAMLGLQVTGGQLGYLAMMSVAAAGMLVSVLLDTALAVMVVALLAVLSGLVMNHEIRFTVLTLMSSLVAIANCQGVRSRANLLGTSVILSSANLGLAFLMGLLMRDSWQELLTGSGWAALMGFAATSIYWFGVLAFEKPFGILTHQTLLEMSSSDRPLLQQLCAVAPGTYAHSIMVGTLAEAGAQAIGADALLCRVAGYYHDIGKMKRPEFFVENQRNGNVHGRLSPSLSAIFITAHVKDGLTMAREHRLPQEIQDIIASHHGTTLIGYFYHQALTDCGGSDVAPPGLEERFRYPGPKPSTREAAVVMLADSVEAATRCLERPRRDRLEAEIARIVRGKIEDGQFDDCAITFKDIKGITDAFVHVLEAMMHGRIAYPKLTRTRPEAAPAEQIEAELPPTPQLTPVSSSIGLEETTQAARALLKQFEGISAKTAEEALKATAMEPGPGRSPDQPETEMKQITESIEENHASTGDERAAHTGKDQAASAGRQSPAASGGPLQGGGLRTVNQ